jgi:hypothetical protein
MLWRISYSRPSLLISGTNSPEREPSIWRVSSSINVCETDQYNSRITTEIKEENTVEIRVGRIFGITGVML